MQSTRDVDPFIALTSSCNANGNQITFSWTAPAGYTDFYTRASDNGTNLVGTNPPWNDDFVGTSMTFSVTPGHSYSIWVHTRTSTGAYSDAVYPSPNPITCATLAVTGPSNQTISYPTTLFTTPYTITNGGASPTCELLDYNSNFLATNPCSSGSITWNTYAPSTGGVYGYYFRVTNGSQVVTNPFTVTVNAAPTASLSASPNPVASGGRSTLTWSSTNATSCTAGGPWSNASSPLGPGSGLTDPLASATTFTFQCTGPGGTSPLQSVTVTVAPPAACTATTIGNCSLPATPSGSSSGSCSSGYAGSCNYTCTSETWSQNSNSCVVSAPAPATTLSANPSTMDSGQSSTLTWSSTNATSCTAAGGFSTGGATSGSASTGALTSTQNYQLSCTGPGGSVNSNIATVTVLQPQASISASPMRVQAGSNSQISWSASQVSSCAITKNGAAWRTGLSSPGISENITAQTTYTITCQTNGSSITKSVIVNVTPLFQEF